MDGQYHNGPGSEDSSGRDAVEHLRNAARAGGDWPTALVEAMALWSCPDESFGGRQFKYLIGGEAFDWLLLAERLFLELDGLLPDELREELLFSNRLPGGMDEDNFKKLLGVDKYRGFLNYYYGVTVEEALQVAVEQEVLKRYISNSIGFKGDLAEEASVKIYGASRSELLQRFRTEAGYPCEDTISLGESHEFTYWLFKYRVKRSDKARVASDTRKGLEQLRSMACAPGRVTASGAATTG